MRQAARRHGARFFLTVLVLIPLGVGPDVALPSASPPAPCGSRCCCRCRCRPTGYSSLDHDDGSLEIMVLGPVPLDHRACQGGAHWLATALPMALAALFLGLLLNLDLNLILPLALAMLLASLALSLLASLVRRRRSAPRGAAAVHPDAAALCAGAGVVASSEAELMAGSRWGAHQRCWRWCSPWWSRPGGRCSIAGASALSCTSHRRPARSRHAAIRQSAPLPRPRPDRALGLVVIAIPLAAGPEPRRRAAGLPAARRSGSCSSMSRPRGCRCSPIRHGGGERHRHHLPPSSPTSPPGGGADRCLLHLSGAGHRLAVGQLMWGTWWAGTRASPRCSCCSCSIRHRRLARSTIRPGPPGSPPSSRWSAPSTCRSPPGRLVEHPAPAGQRVRMGGRLTRPS